MRIAREMTRVRDGRCRWPGSFYVLLTDGAEEARIRQAGLERARSMVAVPSMPTDAENVFLTLTARRIAPNVEVDGPSRAARDAPDAAPGGGRPCGDARRGRRPQDRLAARRGPTPRPSSSPSWSPDDRAWRSRWKRSRSRVPGSARRPLPPRRRHEPEAGVMVIAVKRADGRVEFHRVRETSRSPKAIAR